MSPGVEPARPGTARRSPVLPAAVGAGAALLALATLGLTWVRRSVDGPLGEASAAQVEALSGRDVAPVVAALVPGTAAVVVVALLLRGWWRAGALAVAALTATGAAAAAAGVLLPGGAGEGGTVTATPAVAALACLLAAAGAAVGAVAALRSRPTAPVVAASQGGSDGATTGTGTVAEPVAPRSQDPDPGPADPADLWRALDDGRDPT